MKVREVSTDAFCNYLLPTYDAFPIKGNTTDFSTNLSSVTRSLNTRHYTNAMVGSRRHTPNDVTYNTSTNASNSIFSHPVETDQTQHSSKNLLQV